MHTDVGCATNTTCAGTIPCAAIVLDGPRVQTLDPLPTLSCSEFSGAQTYVSAASTDHRSTDQPTDQQKKTPEFARPSLTTAIVPQLFFCILPIPSC